MLSLITSCFHSPKNLESSIEGESSFSKRVIKFVKSVLSYLLYFLTCTKVDLREKTITSPVDSKSQVISNVHDTETSSLHLSSKIDLQNGTTPHLSRVGDSLEESNQQTEEEFVASIFRFAGLESSSLLPSFVELYKAYKQVDPGVNLLFISRTSHLEAHIKFTFSLVFEDKATLEEIAKSVLREAKSDPAFIERYLSNPTFFADLDKSLVNTFLLKGDAYSCDTIQE